MKEGITMVNIQTKHPCFNAGARHQYGRLHLPVAPKCNIQCNFCNRKYDCVNESRPGVTSRILSPGQALRYVENYLEQNANLSTIGIAGPGDPMANPEETLQTISLIQQHYSNLIFCLATNGLNLAPYIKELAESGVTHVTVTVNAVDPVIGARIYAWVRDGKVIYRGVDGALHLLGKQLEAIAELKRYGITVKINTIIIPGVNDDHISEVAQKMAALGVDVMNCIPLYPAAGSNFEQLNPPAAEEVDRIRAQAEKYLPQMKHCARCRADAAGLIGAKMEAGVIKMLETAAKLPIKPQEERPYIAVATMEGLLVNQHLGEATWLHIFKTTTAGIELVETRETPKPGGGVERWKALADSLKDCHTILVSGVGENPSKVLKDSGIKVYETEGMIETAVGYLLNGQEIPKKATVTKCGFSCKGDGLGCG
jgi:nitrogen fixation protein NifB